MCHLDRAVLLPIDDMIQAFIAVYSGGEGPAPMSHDR